MIKLSIIIENIKKIKATLPDYVNLIAVSKTRSLEEINEAYDAGIRDFGENKVQELVNKIDSFGKGVRWHLIGHLQSNKVKYIVGKVFLIHSIDSIDLIDEVEKRYKAAGITADVLIQINIAKEKSKSGVYLENLKDLIERCENCNYIKVKGLMGVIPVGTPENCKDYFRQLKSIFESLKNENLKNITMEYLSIGMSNDYIYAIDEGSNMIRIGEGIFGKRNYNLNL